MTWYAIPVLLSASLLIIAFQWKWVRRSQSKEKAVYFVLLTAAWILAILLYAFPNLPGPSQLVNAVFGPLGSYLIDRGKVGS